MTQVNLVPDIKQKYLKAQRMKRVIIVGSFFVSAGFITVVVLMFMFVNVAQKRHNTNLESDIKSGLSKLQAEQDVAKVLTIQKQLETLPGLHANKPQMSRLALYLSKLIPKNVWLDELSIDMKKKTIEVRGDAGSVRSVNVFIDSMKNATYTVEGQDVNKNPAKNAFSAIALDNLGTDNKTGSVSYRIVGTFDPVIFTEAKQVNMDIPNITSTQSETEKPKVFGSGSGE